ncbi:MULTISPECIES: carboxypeptidase regulatory-like domain-containing protein [unclassified Streptomyces]|uniref:carboxypeptidase regulatory-like domain-containing protein n=1 Tax=unclassified Streptomyces TaxID=2593676 RepID=UPI0036F0ABBA
MIFRRTTSRRRRTPLSLLLAGCMGLALLGAAPVTATAAGSTDPSDAASLTDAPDYAPADCAVPEQEDQARCYAMVRTDKNRKAALRDSGPAPTALGPADIKAAYNLPDGGKGQTVAVVLANGNSHAEDDLAVFRSHYGLSPCTTANGCFRKVDQRGGTDYPADDEGWALESALDVDAVSSACPACNILMVEADSAGLSDLGAAVDTAVELGAKFVSNSYGLPGEHPFQTFMDEHYDHPGVAMTVSSGDIGHVQSWPATNPNVTAVGGTSLTRDGDTDRGWRESAWADGGSGCGLYSTRPAYQAGLDTGCETRSTADISAVADPYTGLAVYSSLGADGWAQVGGTSLSSPLVAGMYALAGTPAEGTYPVTYPYSNGGGLHDVDTGTNDTCGDVTCTAGRGYDGPTGLGTPDGVSALGIRSFGTLTGKVTDRNGAPVASAAVTFTDKAEGRSYTATTDAKGAYTQRAAVGTYTLTTSHFSYEAVTRSSLRLSEGDTVRTDIALKKLPTRTLSGKVTDGGEHGWPLYAKVAVDGYPYAPVYTRPETGTYSVELPKSGSYKLRVTPVSSGYEAQQIGVEPGTSDLTRDVRMGVDKASCVAAGYGYGVSTGFEQWTGTEPREGWTVDKRGTAGYGWDFNHAWFANATGGTGGYAVVSPLAHEGAAMDTDLVSPPVDLRGRSGRVQFDTVYAGTMGASADAEVSTDGGATWLSVWHVQNGRSLITHVDVDVPEIAGKSGVTFRFRFSGSDAAIWEVDSVQIGSCTPIDGGLVAGRVIDGNTGDGIDAALVTAGTDQDGSVVATAAADDPAAPSGFYALFAEGTGRRTFNATANRYTSGAGSAKVVADRLNRLDITLQTGRLAVQKGKLSFSGRHGTKATQTVKLTNTGRVPLHVDLGEQSTGYTAPSSTTGTAETAASTDSAWRPVAAYPEPIRLNTAALHEGKVYSVGGYDNNVAPIRRGYVYDPVADAWTRIADMPTALQEPASGFVGGTLYVVGMSDGVSQLYAYHPGDDKWTRRADLPVPVSSNGASVLGGRLYVLGADAQMYSYAPATDSWTRRADYPEKINRGGCASVAAEIICAGGVSNSEVLTSVYRFNPAANTWTRAADLPSPAWGMNVAGANGRLQVVGGNGEYLSRAVAEFDPVTNVWKSLHDADFTAYYAGGSCGLYQVGGLGQPGTVRGGTRVAVLPGYDQCSGDDVTWLSENRAAVDLAPGRSVTVEVSVDSSVLSGPGDYAAKLNLDTDTPYLGQSIKTTLHVTAPRGKGKTSH